MKIRLLLLLMFCMGCVGHRQKKSVYKIDYLESSMVVYSNQFPQLREDMKVYKYNGIRYRLVLHYKE